VAIPDFIPESFFCHKIFIEALTMKRIVIALALLAPTPALANLDADAQVWTTLQWSGSLSGPVMINGDAQARFSNDQDRLYEAQFTTHLGYKVSKRVTTWVGYRHVINYRGPQPATIEHRIRPYVTIDLGKIAGGSLASRTVVELRWRDKVVGTGWRFRQQLKWSKPFKKGGKTAFVLAHEDFVGLNGTSFQQNGYNRMRNFIGVNTPIVGKIKAEFGYQNQWDIRRNADDRMAHVGMVTMSYSF
jgi:hypothetical protein